MGDVVIKVATLPRGVKDVDELLRTDGGDSAYERMIATARPYPSWMIANLDQRHDIETVKGATDACQDMIDVLLRQPPVARARYVRELAEKLGEDERTIRQTLNECVRDRQAHYAEHPEDVPNGPPLHAIRAAVIEL